MLMKLTMTISTFLLLSNNRTFTNNNDFLSHLQKAKEGIAYVKAQAEILQQQLNRFEEKKAPENQLAEKILQNLGEDTRVVMQEIAQKTGEEFKKIRTDMQRVMMDLWMEEPHKQENDYFVYQQALINAQEQLKYELTTKIDHEGPQGINRLAYLCHKYSPENKSLEDILAQKIRAGLSKEAEEIIRTSSEKLEKLRQQFENSMMRLLQENKSNKNFDIYQKALIIAQKSLSDSLATNIQIDQIELQGLNKVLYVLRKNVDRFQK